MKSRERDVTRETGERRVSIYIHGEEDCKIVRNFQTKSLPFYPNLRIINSCMLYIMCI